VIVDNDSFLSLYFCMCLMSIPVGLCMSTKTGSKSQDELDELDDFQETVSLRYYLRIVIQNSYGRSCWNTTEIELYSSKPPQSITADPRVTFASES
jgi:hypothetical protein